VVKLTIEQLRHCTCKRHYEERCRILYNEGKVLCWRADKNFKEAGHCIICKEEELVKLRETNKQINKKRLFLIQALDAAWQYIDTPITDMDAKDRTLERMTEFKKKFKEDA
jgi:hypothetical protein